MVEACLRTQTHYLDITGEVSVFEVIAALDAEAKSLGVMLLPGVGYSLRTGENCQSDRVQNYSTTKEHKS